jgi:hypothetical protein
MQLAGINELNFEPKMAVDLAAVATTSTPTTLRPYLGPLSELNFIPARCRFYGRLNQQATGGAVVVSLKTEAGTLVKSWTFDITNQTDFGADDRVNLSNIAGADNLVIEVDVQTAAQAGTTATVDAFVVVELPLTISGC